MKPKREIKKLIVALREFRVEMASYTYAQRAELRTALKKFLGIVL